MKTTQKPSSQLITLALIIFVFLSASQIFSQTLNRVELDSLIEKTISVCEVPGIAVSVIVNGEVVYQKGFGFKNLETKENVTPETLFYIASASKPFTAVLAGILQDERKINIDMPIKAIIKDFNMQDKMAAERITLKDMFTHRTGIPREKFFTLNNIESRKDVRKSYSLFEPIADFRTNFQYSNENYTVAGDLIAEVAGKSWENLIKEKIFSPLNMKNSYFTKDEIGKANYATPYIDYGEGLEKLDLYDAKFLGAAGCIISNVQDLTNWVKFYLERGKFNGSQLINSAFLIKQLSAQIPTIAMSSYPELSFECYGMGWFLDYYRGNFHVHHGGVLYGYSSLVSFLPYKKSGVIILANKNNTYATSVIEKFIYDKLLGLEPVNWLQRLKAREDKMLEMIKNNKKNSLIKTVDIFDKKDVNKYLGEYYNEAFGKIKIQFEGGQLFTMMRDLKCIFKRIENNKFELYHPVERQGWEVNFESANDKITSFYVSTGVADQKVLYKLNKAK